MPIDLSDAQYVINPRSGGGSGARVLRELSRLLPRAAVDDLLTIDCRKMLITAARDQRTVVVCGGDGSIAAVLDMVYDIGLDIAVALIPLGTGNDLARHLQCRGPADVDLQTVLAELEQAQPQVIDRMLVEGPSLQRSWYNYCSWGLDAEIALHFDRLRTAHRRICRSSEINKLIYAFLGLRMLGRNLSLSIESNMNLPTATRSLLCANINSYAGGMPLGPQVLSDDGLSDVFALPVSPMLAPAMFGLRRLRSLQQSAEMEILLKQKMCMQCDGEAFLVPAGFYRVCCVGQVPILSRRHIYRSGS